MKTTVYKIYILLLLATYLFSGENGYHEPEEGWYPAENTPVYTGGYISLHEEITEKNSRFSIYEAALMLYGEFDRSGFMSEFELYNFYVKDSENSSKEGFNKRVYIERLYFYLYPDERSEITVGKFYSHIGFWNRMSIDVLRDTTSDPYFIYTIFPISTTGILYKREFKEGGSASISIQHNDDIHTDINSFHTDRHYSISLNMEQDTIEWRTAAGWYRIKTGKSRWYMALSFQKLLENMTILGESAVAVDSSFTKGFSYDLYIQDTWHIRERHDIIFRIEKYKESSISQTRDLTALAGYTYRPRPHIALKAEYNMYERKSGKALFSFSLMF